MVIHTIWSHWICVWERGETSAGMQRGSMRNLVIDEGEKDLLSISEGDVSKNFIYLFIPVFIPSTIEVLILYKSVDERGVWVYEEEFFAVVK